MKQFTILFCIYLLSATNVQSQTETICPEDRYVMSETVTLWQNNYVQIQKDGLLGMSSDVNPVFITKTTLLEFLQYEIEESASGELSVNEVDTITCPTFNFWFYMNSDSVLQTALGMNGNSADLLRYLDGGWQPSDNEDIQEDIERWKTYTMDSNSILVYVSKYSFNLASIDSLINIEGFKGISIENVIHSVAPNSDKYDLTYKTDYETKEGYLAVDILLNVITSENSSDIHDCYNFAMPCPKNCPEK
jgi:hypothetical protein